MAEPDLWEFDRALFAGRPGVGVDEAGRGPLAGPVVACAVLFPAFSAPLLPGLRDGKTLSPVRRSAFFREARRRGVRWALAAAGPREIDERNILRASLEAMRRAVRRLAPPPGVRVAVDGVHRVAGLPFEQAPVVDGDAQSWSVALAGVLAKVVRDRWMAGLDRAHPGYGFRRNKGYGTAEHLSALGRIGPSSVHRLSFAPVARAARKAAA